MYGGELGLGCNWDGGRPRCWPLHECKQEGLLRRGQNGEFKDGRRLEEFSTACVVIILGGQKEGLSGSSYYLPPGRYGCTPPWVSASRNVKTNVF